MSQIPPGLTVGSSVFDSQPAAFRACFGRVVCAQCKSQALKPMYVFGEVKEAGLNVQEVRRIDVAK